MERKHGIQFWAREVTDLRAELREAREAEAQAKAKRKEIESNLTMALVELEHRVREKTLTWPVAQPRARRRRSSKFDRRLTVARAVNDLTMETSRLGAREVIISSDLKLRRDGLPRGDQGNPADPGVAIYFERRMGDAWQPFVIACDTYFAVQDNLRAIAKTVEAMRAIERHGSSALADRAFSGFAAIPEKVDEDRPWWAELGLQHEPKTLDAARAAYRARIQKAHPDRGGSEARMRRLNAALERAREVLA